MNLDRVIKVLSAFCFCLAIVSVPAAAQQSSGSSPDYVPAELQASESEIKAYVDSTEKLAKEGNYPEVLVQLQKAIDLCVRKGFLADKALLEAKLGSDLFLQGKLEDAKKQWISAFSDSTQTGNLVLQADTLVALSGMAQAAGNMHEALDLAAQALNLAKKSKDFFIQSRCLGELGRLQLTVDRRDEARASIEEALHIDRLNHYKWESTHLLYLAWVSQSGLKFDETVRLANSARELAIAQENYVVFMQASESLGRAYVSTKELAQAIALLEHSRDGVTDNGKQLFRNPASYRAAMSQPYLKVSFLEAIALAYQVGQRTDDAVKAWQELFDLAQKTGFALAAAEASHSMADIWKTKKEVAKAITCYELAAQAWAKGGNLQRQIDAFTAEAALLAQEENSKGAQVYEKALSLIKVTGDKTRQFFVDLCIAELMQPKGDLDQSLNALQDAESLLASDLTLKNVEPKFILELYLRMADMQGSKNDKIHQLIALEKAMIPADGINAKTMASVKAFVEEKVNLIRSNKEAESAYDKGDLSGALVYFELLQNFEQTDARANGVSYNTSISNPIVARLFEIPKKIVAQSGGDVFLETNIRQMGPAAGLAKLPILLALSTHFEALQRHDQVVRFDSEAMQYVNLDNPGTWDVAVVCHYTISLMIQKDMDSALKEIGPCLKGAQKVGDPQLLARAHQTTVWVLEAAGRREEAGESIRYLLQHTPDDPSTYVQKAQLDALQGKANESLEAWKQALFLFDKRSDWRNAASVHLSIASSLSTSKKESYPEQREHLEAALDLYKKLNDESGEARTSMFLAELFAKQGDLARAHSLLDIALKLSRQNKKADLEALTLSQMGQLYRPSRGGRSSGPHSHSSHASKKSHASGSHDGHYAGGHGSSHKGGHYKNSKTGNHYRDRKHGTTS
jgi:tetratricopeptide (TPR) repeat protein